MDDQRRAKLKEWLLLAGTLFMVAAMAFGIIMGLISEHRRGSGPGAGGDYCGVADRCDDTGELPGEGAVMDLTDEQWGDVYDEVYERYFESGNRDLRMACAEARAKGQENEIYLFCD